MSSLKRKYSGILKLAFLVLFLFSCVKDLNTIPETYVFLKIYLTDPIYQALQIEGNSIHIMHDQYGDGIGNEENGLIIYRHGNDEFYAYDRTCPFDWEQGKNIAINSDGSVVATCPECGSIFILSASGAPTDAGPATIPLKEYRSSFNVNTQKLIITNYN
jgi:hypothetical protein